MNRAIKTTNKLLTTVKSVLAGLPCNAHVILNMEKLGDNHLISGEMSADDPYGNYISRLLDPIISLWSLVITEEIDKDPTFRVKISVIKKYDQISVTNSLDDMQSGQDILDSIK